MRRTARLLTLVVWTWMLTVVGSVDQGLPLPAKRRQGREGAGASEPVLDVPMQARSAADGANSSATRTRTTTTTSPPAKAGKPLFLTPKTTRFAVNGSAIPEVPFDVGESYAGSLPTGGKTDGELWFWFFPSTNTAARRRKELVVWLNGGPGCSSLEGLLQGNGPFLWQYGTFRPVANPYSWHNQADVVWIDQPVGSGFATGKVTATSEEDVAVQFMGFWRNFIDTFALQNYSIYLTGESYAGQYLPYIGSAFLDARDRGYYDVKGVLLYDPLIDSDEVENFIPAVRFAESWAGLLTFNATFRAETKARDKACGFSAWLDRYLVYPAQGHMPPFPNTFVLSCGTLVDDMIAALLQVNPCFNYYQITGTCPLQWDVLGYPGSFEYQPAGSGPVYFDRADVKKAIHAPDRAWTECSHSAVFVNGGSTSLPSRLHALPRVIEETKNVVIGQGGLDMVVIANGTLLAIQNMTWAGQTGFRSAPRDAFIVPYHQDASDASLAGAGVMGTVHSERGLTYVSVDLAGHMVPQSAPAAAYRHLEFLLGRVGCMNCSVPLTTRPTLAEEAPPTPRPPRAPRVPRAQRASRAPRSVPGAAATQPGISAALARP